MQVYQEGFTANPSSSCLSFYEILVGPASNEFQGLPLKRAGLAVFQVESHHHITTIHLILMWSLWNLKLKQYNRIQ